MVVFVVAYPNGRFDWDLEKNIVWKLALSSVASNGNAEINGETSAPIWGWGKGCTRRAAQRHGKWEETSDCDILVKAGAGVRKQTMNGGWVDV